MNLKKILALVLVFAMCLSMIPTYAFAEDEGIELVEEEPEAIVEVVDEPEEEPSTEPEEEETPQEPVEEEVPEEPAPTEEEPAEEPEEEEEEEELVLTSEGVKDDESFEAGYVKRVVVIHADTTESEFSSLSEAVADSTTQPGDSVMLVTDTTLEKKDQSELFIESNPIVIGKPLKIYGQGFKINQKISTGYNVEFFDVTFTDAAGIDITGGPATDPAVSIAGSNVKATFTNVTFGVDAELEVDITGAENLVTLENVSMLSTGKNISASADTGISIKGENGVFSGRFYAYKSGGATFEGKMSITGGYFSQPILKKWIAFGYTTANYSSDFEGKDYCTGLVVPTTAQAAIWTAQLKDENGDDSNNGGWIFFDDANAALAAGFGTYSAGDNAAKPVAFINTPATITYQMPIYKGEQTGYLKIYVNDNMPQDLVIPSKAQSDGYFVSLATSTDTGAPLEQPVKTPVDSQFDWMFVLTSFRYAAKIGDTGYDSLKAAYAKYQAGETIELFRNPTPTELVELANNASVKIKTNGFDVVVDDGSGTTVNPTIKAKNSAYRVTVTEDKTTHVNTYTALPATFVRETKIGQNLVTYQYATFKDALAAATATDVIMPIANTGAKIDEEVTIDKNVTIQSVENAPVIITAPVTIEATVTVSGTVEMSDSACFEIARGELNANGTGVFAVTGVDHFATLASRTSLTIGCTVNLNGLKDSAIVADGPAKVRITGTVVAGANAIPATASLFNGGVYTIEGSAPDADVIVAPEAGAFGFENADVTIIGGKVAVTGVKEGTVIVDASKSTVTLPDAPKTVFALGDEDYVLIENANSWQESINTTGLVAMRYDGDQLENQKLFPSFKAAAEGAAFTKNEQVDPQKKTITLLVAPEADDFYQFTDPQQMLAVITELPTVTFTNLAKAYSDEEHGEQLYYYVNVEKQTTPEYTQAVISQARATAIIRDKDTKEYVKGYGSFAEAATPTDYDPATQEIYIRNKDTSDVVLTKELNEIFVVCEAGASVVKPTTTLEAHRVLDLEAEGYTHHYVLADEHVQITWNAGDGYWFKDGLPEKDPVTGKIVTTKNTIGTQSNLITEFVADPFSNDDTLAFVGWTVDGESEPVDFDTYKLPTDTNVLTLNATYEQAKVTMLDKGDYVHNFATVEAAYKFKASNSNIFDAGTYPTVLQDVVLYVDDDAFYDTVKHEYQSVYVINRNGANIDARMNHQNPDVATASSLDIDQFWVVTCTDLGGSRMKYDTAYKYAAAVESGVWTQSKKNTGDWAPWELVTQNPTQFFETLAEAVEAGIADPYKEEGRLRTETRKSVFVPAYNTEETYELADAALQGSKSLQVVYAASTERPFGPITRGNNHWAYVTNPINFEPSKLYTAMTDFWHPVVTVTFVTTHTDLTTMSEVQIGDAQFIESSTGVASPTELPEFEGYTFQYFCTDTNKPEASKVEFTDGQYTVYATPTDHPTDSNLTIYAYYDRTEYTVTLAYFDEVKQEIATSTTLTGQYMDPVNIDEATGTDLLDEFEREFDFWSLTTGTDAKVVTPTDAYKGNVTYYAIAKPEITFMASIDGVATDTNKQVIRQKRGTNIATATVVDMQTVLFKDAFDGKLREFDYWSLTPNGDPVATDTILPVPNVDTTYYAVAKPWDTVTVNVLVNGKVATSTTLEGNRGADIDQKALVATVNKLLEDKNRIFDFWATDTDVQVAVATPSTIGPDTYYAVAMPEITVMAYVDGNPATDTSVVEHDKSRGTEIPTDTVLNMQEKLFAKPFDGKGRVFDHWANEAGEPIATPTAIPAEDTTYYAVAKPWDTVTVILYVDGKETATKTTIEGNRGAAIDQKALVATITDLFEEIGRVFDFFATPTDASVDVGTPTNIGPDTYYAVAKPMITVTLSSWIDPEVATSTSWSENPGKTADGDEVKEFFEDAQTALFKGTERKFHHWATSTDVNAEAIATPTKLTFDEDQTYYAIPAPVYTLTLKYGEKTEKIVGDADYPVDEKKVASATNALFAGTGDEFADAWTDELGSPTNLPKTYTADLTFVAVAQPKVEVTFDAGSGVFKDPVTGKNTNTSTTKANKTYPVDEKYQLLWSESKPSRPNYVFNGWLDENNKPVLATQTIVTPTTLTADWSGVPVSITFYDSYSRKSIPTASQYYGDDLKVPTVAEVEATVGSRTGYTFFSDDLWEEDLVTPIAGNKTYNLKWYQVLSSVPCIVAEPEKETQVYEFRNKAAVGRTLDKPDELNNVKRDGKIANWLINGDPERYFQFTDEDLVPEDLEFFLATFTDAPVPTPTDLFTVTWATDAGAKILEIDEDVLYGSKPEFNGVVPTMTNTKDEFYYFDGWTIFGKTPVKVYTEDELPAVTEDFEFHAHFTAVPHAESGLRSLSLGDSIAIKWRLNPDSIDSHADMSLYRAEYTFTNGEGVETAGTITGDNLLVASPIAYCAAKEMTLPVTVTLFYDDVEIAEFEYTVRDYCLDGLKRDLGAKWSNLFAATLDYGAGAQTFRNFKTDDLANAGVTYEYTKQDVANATVTKSTGVTFNLITEAETLLQVKFATGGKDISDFTFKVGTKDVTDTVFVENNKFVVNIGGIPARQLDQSVTVTMTPKADGEILRFLGSPVGYMRTAFVNGKAPLPEFMKAMYNYHFYAKAAQG